METKTKDSTIRWIAYPIILIMAPAFSQECKKPDALIFQGCTTNTDLQFSLIIISVAILEYFLWKRKEEIALEKKREINKKQRETERYEQEAQEREEEFIDANRQEKLQIYRTDIIKKLGSVGNYLNHLIDPKYFDKQGYIKQQIAIEFNDIIAKYPLDDLREIIHKNEEIQHKLRSLDKKCNLWKIENDDLEIMLKLLPQD